MNFISHVPSPRSLSNSFHCWLNPFSFHSRSISTIHGGVSHRHLKTEEEFSSKSCPFSRRFVLLASCYPLELFHWSDIPFPTHPEYVRSCFFISFHRRPSFQLSFSIYPGASFKCSLSAHDLFVLLHLNPLKHICSSNSSM